MTEEHPSGDREAFEERWENVDQKTLFAQMLGELGAIRRELEYLNREVDHTRHQGAGEDEVRCGACGEMVGMDDRVNHAVNAHGAPSDMAAEDLPMYR